MPNISVIEDHCTKNLTASLSQSQHTLDHQKYIWTKL